MKVNLISKSLFALVFAFLLGASVNAQTVEDKTQIIQAALDLPELQPYFKGKAETQQLYILDNGTILKSLKLKKFGKPVIIASVSNIPPNAPFVEFGQADFKSSFANISLKYPAESVKVEAKFSKKGNKWTKVSAHIK